MKIARPLPECRVCETPTARAAWLENGGLCTPCVEGITSTVRMTRLPPAPDEFGDRTVVVEGYRPPVPGQLAIEVEQEKACRWAHGPVSTLDARGLCRVCAEDDE